MRRTVLSVVTTLALAVTTLSANAVADRATTTHSASLTASPQRYLVGAATRDITPKGTVHLGGFGLGDGTSPVSQAVGPGDNGAAKDQRIRARAIVFDDGVQAIAIADIETQGMFAAYQDGKYGLSDMADAVAKAIPRLPHSHILIASDHTHKGPDTIGVWGGVSNAYLEYIKTQTVAAIKAAYANRQAATIVAGHSDASDLIYNQSCAEALYQSQDGDGLPDGGWNLPCPTRGKDGMVRVVQARTPRGRVVATLMVFAAHSTTNIGDGITGDWPQFLGDAMARKFGGVGMGMEGANGGTQPCRPTCMYTSKSNPGYGSKDRTKAIVANYMAHVSKSLARATPVTGPVRAAQGVIREAITGPAVLGLFTAGSHIGSRLLRSYRNPWVVGETIRTVTSALRVGSLLFAGTPGEGFPAIRTGIANAVTGASEVIQLGLANDQLGYLIAPVAYVVPIAAEVAVNDNIIFNVSPTIGDHVMCSDIALAQRIGFAVAAPSASNTSLAACAPYTAADAAGDPVAKVPVGGIVIP